MMEERVLFVDDDPNILQAFQRQLHKVLKIETALGGKEGIEVLTKNRRHPFAVIVSDMQMPGMNGADFLAKAKEISPNSVRIMLTGFTDIESAIKAVNEGNIFRFLTKPCQPDVMGKSLLAGIEQYRLITSEKILLDKTLKGSIQLLTEVLSLAEPQAFGRGIRLRDAVRAIAPVLGILDYWEVEMASMFSQIGYITVPTETINKKNLGEPLSSEEQDIIDHVPKSAQDLLMNIPRLEGVAKIVLYQNKHFDGSGFPDDSLAGEKIPLESRALKVLLDLDELMRKGESKASAVGKMVLRSGWYDPRILNIVAETSWDPGETNVDEIIQLSDETLRDLRVGDTLLSDVRTQTGSFLISQGSRVTEPLFIRLKNYAQLKGITLPLLIKREPQKENQDTV